MNKVKIEQYKRFIKNEEKVVERTSIFLERNKDNSKVDERFMIGNKEQLESSLRTIEKYKNIIKGMEV